MRLILLLLVVRYATLSLCEEGRKPNVFCYEGVFTESDGSYSNIFTRTLMRSHSCFTHFESECAISFDVRNVSGLYNTTIECFSHGCNHNLQSQMEQLKIKGSPLIQSCNKTYTELLKQERQRSDRIYCLVGGPDYKNLSIKLYQKECFIGITEECSLYHATAAYYNVRKSIACQSDGCNANLKAMLDNWGDEDRDLYDRCKAKLEKKYKPAPVFHSNLRCAMESEPKKSSNSEWSPIKIKEYRPFCYIGFGNKCSVSFDHLDFLPIGTPMNSCHESTGHYYKCYCNSSDLCNIDIEKWGHEVKKLNGSRHNFIENCNYTDYRYPKSEWFSIASEVTTTLQTTTTTQSTTAPDDTVVSMSPPQNNGMPNQRNQGYMPQMYGSNTSPSTVAFFVLLLLMNYMLLP